MGPNYKGFAMAIMEDWPDTPNLDGFDIQDLAVKHGLLNPVTVTEPCGDNCNCLEWIAPDEFPTTCYRLVKDAK